jgi:hypothetical protein
VNRGMYLLASTDNAVRFRDGLLQAWQTPT